jgi:cytochrome c oxidase subunit 1
MFGIGGLTGLPLGLSYVGLQLHDTYYVIAHFHYIVAPGTIFAIFAGIYHWFPKMTGRMMNETLGKIHFWGSLVFMNLIFQPMFAQGMAGMHRRMYDGGVTYSLAQEPEVVGALSEAIISMNKYITHAAFGLLIFQLPFIWNFFYSIVKGKKAASDNPWQATTLEWQTPTPPPHGNFTKTPEVHRGPYEYSQPGAKQDFTPQNQPG